MQLIRVLDYKEIVTRVNEHCISALKSSELQVKKSSEQSRIEQSKEQLGTIRKITAQNSKEKKSSKYSSKEQLRSKAFFLPL